MSHFPESTNLIIGWFKDELNAQAYEAVQGIKEKLTNYYHAHEFMTEDLNLIVNMVTDELHKNQAQVRRDALLEAAKLVCGDCGQGKRVEKVGDGWQHPAKIYRGTVIEKDGHVLCRAENIHTELAADQGQGGERS
jgi:hypothetical protein